LTFEVYPLSFREYVDVVQPGLKPEGSANHARLAMHFERFLQQGGFPAVIALSDELLRQKELQGYFDVMLLRDLAERYSVSQIATLRYFCKRVIGASASEFSVNKVYLDLKSQNYKVSKDILYGYQDSIEAVYLSRFVTKYDESVVKSENSQKKPYVIDPGLGVALDFKLSQDRGRLLETMVALELIKQGFQPMYYKDDNVECDFVISDRGQVQMAMQASISLEDPATRERKIRGLVRCCKRLGLGWGVIVTLDAQETLYEDDIRIEVVPAWRHFWAAPAF
jgi:predicted AAA+ superfamily ATPase